MLKIVHEVNGLRTIEICQCRCTIIQTEVSWTVQNSKNRTELDQKFELEYYFELYLNMASRLTLN